MGQEVEKTVRTVSDGTVTIAVETYQDLLAKAAEKAPVVYNSVIKTPEMAAADHKILGIVFGLGGAALVALGVFMHAVGRSEEKELEKK